MKLRKFIGGISATGLSALLLASTANAQTITDLMTLGGIAAAIGHTAGIRRQRGP